jgi:hypothetical protein
MPFLNISHNVRETTLIIWIEVQSAFIRCTYIILKITESRVPEDLNIKIVYGERILSGIGFVNLNNQPRRAFYLQRFFSENVYSM